MASQMKRIFVVSTYSPTSRGFGGITHSVTAYLKLLSSMSLDTYFLGSNGSLQDCVASSTSGQKASGEMRDFDLLQAACRGSEVNEQTRASTIYGGAEIRDFARGGSTWCAGERGMPASRFVALGILSLAGGGPGRLGGG